MSDLKPHLFCEGKMSEKECCGNCRFSEYVSSSHQQISTICRRHAPVTVQPINDYSRLAGNPIWPAVGTHDYCGDFQPIQQHLTTD